MVHEKHFGTDESKQGAANKALACMLSVALGAGMVPVFDRSTAFATDGAESRSSVAEQTSDESTSGSEDEASQLTENGTTQDGTDEREPSAAETAPDANENAVMGSSARSVQDESADAEEVSDPQQENSWRFSNGQLLDSEDIDTTGEGFRKARSIVNNGGYKAFNWFDAVGGACPSEGASTGIDVSEHNGNINWTAVRNAGVNFAVIRCGYGQDYSSQDDKKWMQNVQGCNAAGMPFGVYLYSYAKDTASARSEADHVVRCLKAASSHLGNFKLPIYYDMEDDSTSNANLAAIAQAFMGRLADHGYRNVGVYANTSWWNNKLTNGCFNNWHRWVAQYNTTGLVYSKFNKSTDIWQFSSAGAVDGISGRTDLNYSHISSLPRRSGWSWHGSHWMYWENGDSLKSCTKVIGGATYRFNAAGHMLTGWVKEGNTWYLHQSSGAMAKGWALVGHTWYYMDPSTGAMKTGWYNVGSARYYSDSSGAMKTGWLKDGGHWYWLQSNGAMAKGWALVGRTWYYLNPADGVMKTGWYNVGSARYYSDSSGAMKTGWLKDGDHWYWLQSNGAMAKGWALVGRTWYYLNPADGVMKTGFYDVGSKRYYSDSSGAMKTGWVKVSGKWYWMDASGAMAKNRWISGIYWVGADGVMATNAWVDNNRYYVNASGVWVPGAKK